jgi:prepilin-type N-terminal cleavage/methylation domain-containing protein
MNTKKYYVTDKLNIAGFTLIEVLVATLILSSVVYIGTLSYSMFLDAWGKKRVEDINAIHNYRYHMLLKSALESIYDYYVTDRISEKAGFYYPFFRGGREKIEFVTLSSAFRERAPALARLRVIRQKEGQHLLYEEMPLDNAYIKYNDFQAEYNHSFITYSDIEKITIRYYGEVERRLLPYREEFERLYGWTETFQGESGKGIPRKIEIILERDDEVKKLLFLVRADNIFKKGFFQSEY